MSAIVIFLMLCGKPQGALVHMQGNGYLVLPGQDASIVLKALKEKHQVFKVEMTDFGGVCT